MQIEELFKIWDRFESSKATEFLFEADGQKLCLKKEIKSAAPVIQSIPQSVVQAAPVSAPQTEAPAAPAVSDVQVSGTPVKAPFVGTFYRAAAPGEDPFVKLGQRVSKGDVIGIIEAMKLMNEITAPCDGVITDIFVEDEKLVEYDQVLMSIGE